MPVVAPVLIPLLAMVAALGALILFKTENMWLRPLVEALQHPKGSWIKRTVFKSVGFLAKGTLYIERHVRAALSHFAAASLGLLTQWFNGLAAVVHHVFYEVEHLADDVADSLGYLVHHRIPAMIRAIAHPIDVRARAGLATAHRSISLLRELDRRLSRGIDRLRNLVEEQVLARLHGIDRLLHETISPRVRAAERAIADVVSRDLPALRARERALEREVYGDLRARIGRIEKALGLGIFAAVVYRILAKVAPWLFCRNVNKLGRTVCGLNESAMADVLALLVGALLLSDIRSLAKAAEAVEAEVAQEVKRLLSA